MKEVQDLEDNVSGLEQQRIALIERRDLLSENIQTLKGEIEDKSEQFDVEFFHKKQDKYKVRLSDLVINGTAETTLVFDDFFEVTYKSLSKGESLELDKYIKKLHSEPRLYVENMMRVSILARAIVSFGAPGEAISIPEELDDAVAAIQGLNEKIFDKLWSEWIEYSRWIEAGLRTQLKNS